MTNWLARESRIAYFWIWLCGEAARPEELTLVTSGYRAELEKMHEEVLIIY